MKGSILAGEIDREYKLKQKYKKNDNMIPIKKKMNIHVKKETNEC